MKRVKLNSRNPYASGVTHIRASVVPDKRAQKIERLEREAFRSVIIDQGGW